MSTPKRKPTRDIEPTGRGKTTRGHTPSIDTTAGENVAYHHAVQPETSEHVAELREECEATHEAAVEYVRTRSKHYKLFPFVSLFLNISLTRRPPAPGSRAPQLLHLFADEIQSRGLHRRVRTPFTLPNGTTSAVRTPAGLVRLTVTAIVQIVAVDMRAAVRGPGGTPMSGSAVVELIRLLVLCHNDPRAPGLVLKAARKATHA